MTKKQPPSTVIYARVSLDREGNQLAVSRQLKESRALAKTLGLRVVGEFVDNSISATTGKVRPEFERMLEAKPETITVWHTDRLCRMTKDLERVIELGVNVYSVKAGTVDLSNEAGIATARTVTAWATYEVKQKGIRQRSANDQRAESGLPYRGHRAFGYEGDGVTIRESESQEIRACAEGVIASRSLASMAQDLNQRGIPTASGKQWSTTTLKASLLSPRTAGMRQHRGEVVGTGRWPAILDADTATTVRSILTNPSRKRRGPNRRYLLSGVLVCGPCGGPVVGAFVKGKGPTYRCQLLHVTRKSQAVDEFVTELVIARLTQPDAVELWAREEDHEEARALAKEAQGLRTRLDGLAEALALGEIDRQQLAAGSKRLRERMKVVEDMASARVTDPTVRKVASAEDVGLAFRSLTQEVQRSVIAQLLTITLRAVGGGHRVFDPAQSLAVEWKV